MDDLLLDNEGDLIVRNGDLIIGNGDQQNITDILQSSKGEYKRSPQIGLNAANFVSGTTPDQDIKVQAKLQLELDGFRVKEIVVTKEDGVINIEPYAEREL
jgi:hypothetical protein